MKRSLFAALCLLGAPARADEKPHLAWTYEGHASLPQAARAAKKAGTRLLVGLSGSPT